MKKFEYVRRGYEYSNELGQAGWEAVGVFPNTGSILFKREIIEQVKEENFTLTPVSTVPVEVINSTLQPWGRSDERRTRWQSIPNVFAEAGIEVGMAWLKSTRREGGLCDNIKYLAQDEKAPSSIRDYISYFVEVDPNAE